MRPYLYVLIPLGFVALVGTLMSIGEPTGGPVVPISEQIETSPLDTSPSPQPVLDEVIDPDTDSAGVPTPSGPEYGDNQTVLDKVLN